MLFNSLITPSVPVHALPTRLRHPRNSSAWRRQGARTSPHQREANLANTPDVGWGIIRAKRITSHSAFYFSNQMVSWDVAAGTPTALHRGRHRRALTWGGAAGSLSWSPLPLHSSERHQEWSMRFPRSGYLGEFACRSPQQMETCMWGWFMEHHEMKGDRFQISIFCANDRSTKCLHGVFLILEGSMPGTCNVHEEQPGNEETTK